MTDIVKLSEYRNWLRSLKQQIKTGQIKAALSVNSQMIMLYWDLGRQIAEKQETAKWGSSFIRQLSKDLKQEFPEMTGFSQDNLLMMKRFYSNPRCPSNSPFTGFYKHILISENKAFFFCPGYGCIQQFPG